jgi:LPS export ABC transporter protein LptC
MAARNLLWQLPLLILITYPLWRQPVEEFLRPRSAPVRTEAEISSSGGERSGRMEEVIVLQGGTAQRWKIWARQLRSADMKNDIRLEKVRADITGQPVGDGPETVTRIKGDQGRYFARKKRFTVSGNVEMVTADGYMLKAEKLHFFDSGETLKAETDVEFSGDSFLIRGGSLEYDLASGNIVVEGHVQCRLW